MTRLNYLLIAIILIVLTPFVSFSQSLSINTDGSNADVSAMLDVKSTTKGLLIPRMSRTERDAIAAPATGLLIFQNAPDSIGYYYYNGSAWTWLLSNSNADSLAWKTGGNTGTNAASNFIGTQDNVPLVFRANNSEKMRVTPNGELALGTATPNATYGYAKLELASEGYLAPTDLLIRNAVNNTGFAPGLVFQHARGTLATPLAVINGDYLGAPFYSANYDGTAYQPSAGIDVYSDGTVSAGKVPGRIQFNTTDTFGTYAGRLFLKNNGWLGVGVGTPAARLDVTGSNAGTNSVLLRSGNTSVGTASNQLTFGYNGTAQYRHSIKTRHNSVGNGSGNSFDFYLWNTSVDNLDTLGSEPAMTIDGKWKGMVGIGTKTPNSELHISDGSTSLKAVYGSYGASMLITDNNIPRIYLEAAGQPADKKLMDINLINQSIRFGALTDDGGAFTKGDILVVNRDGNVGIGVSSPLVALDVNGSATIGTGNTNTGIRSIVAGNGNNFSGDNSVVSGLNNTVTAVRSSVSGWNNTVGGENNVVGGVGNSIVGGFGHSIMVGNLNILTGSASAVFGYLNNVNGFTTFAAGDRNTVVAQQGSAFGYQNGVVGVGGFVTGTADTTLGVFASAFGTGNRAASYNEMALGMYGTNYTAASISAYNANDRIFNIGNGPNSGSRADALTILKSGNVGIGTATPSTLLDVNSDKIRVRTAKTPTSATDTGNTGDIAWDTDYIYVCVAANTWKRVTIASW
ncbi:MAG: hypothetical protein ABI685_11630 [Ferruginibacter sp.]